MHVIFCQMNHDARMLGLNGSYITLAEGFRSVGINPANLAVYPKTSWNVIDFSLGFKNNFFSIQNYNVLSGAHLDDNTHENYYSKEKILDQFKGNGLSIAPNFHIRFPMFNMSNKQYAFTSSISSNNDIGVSDGMLQFILSGNPLDQNIDFDMNESIDITQEMSFSYGYAFNNFSAGITIKYLMGLFYIGMESISNTTITTDYYGSHGNPQYIIRQEIGGQGLGMDIGITTNEFKDGYRLGLSIINILGTIEWNHNNFIRNALGLENVISETDYYLRPNELTYINMVVDSFVVGNMGDSAVYYEMYNVIPVETIMTPSELSVELSDGTYLYPSGGNYKKYVLLGDGEDTTYVISDDNYLEYSSASDNSFTTRQPMYIRMGVSKRWEGQAVVAIDLVTGFSNRLNSSSNWRFSVGTEITRFKNKFLRLGYAIGGIAGKSLSFGYGAKMGRVYFDLGLSLNGGFSFDRTKGFDVATGIILQLD